jgi:hypothetical protein
VLTTPLSSVFNDLMDALAATDPERLEKILQDPSLELIAAIASHQKVLGEVLVQLDDQGLGTVEQVGWLLIALAEIVTSWHCHT